MAVRKKKTAAKKKVSKPTSVLDKIQPVSELDTNLVMLVYGRSGTGKTAFGATFPKPILFIDTNERGTETIKQESDVDVIRIEDWTELEDLYWALVEGETPVEYASIVIDQITNLQDLGMAEVRRKSRKGRDELFTQKNWGQLSGMLKQAVSDWRELADRYHILFIAHERVFDGGDDEDEAIEPSIGARVMPSVGSFIDGAVDAIGSTYISERWEDPDKKGEDMVRHVDYCMRLGPHAFYSTKIRRPVSAGPIPDHIVDASYPKIQALISGKSTNRKTRRKANAS